MKPLTFLLICLLPIACSAPTSPPNPGTKKTEKDQPSIPSNPRPKNVGMEAKVKRVVDGDTILLDNGERVRLLAVNTPESVHPRKPVEFFGKEASAFTKKMLEGEKVLLVYDQNSAATKHRDRYGRLLAYVYRERDNLDFNAELVKQGYAFAYTRFPTERGDEFLKYQREAKNKKRGLWGKRE